MALLIDGDNAQPSLIANIVAETAKYGTTTVRRVYGDWTTPRIAGWMKTLQTHALPPQQRFRHTSGKNAKDIALIIDAMDSLYSGRVGGFCLVSSDSDFTPLATRILEPGLFVIGIGNPETPKPLVNTPDSGWIHMPASLMSGRTVVRWHALGGKLGKNPHIRR